jgi:predicted glycogen debranching enzyme
MKEWIVTNGLGGYASLTLSNNNTSKFHGLLVAGLEPFKRWVFVTNIYDRIGRDYLKNPGFAFDNFPSFVYGGIKKTVFMEHSKNTTIIKYESEKPVDITHSIIINSRHFYETTAEPFPFEQIYKEGKVIIKPSNVDKTLKIILKDSSFEPVLEWKDYHYEKDRERKDTWMDKCLHIGDFYKTLDGEHYIILTIENEECNPKEIFAKELKRKKGLLKKANLSKELHKLVLSADNFLVNKNGKAIIAGYHWFGEWGRDTLISLPGITLVTKRYEDSKRILLGLARYLKNGLIPNVFQEKPVYNSVDASLWYIDRVYQYLKYTNDLPFLEKIRGTLKSIIESYRKGTDYGIHMDSDYLISHGPGLTWMDVKIGEFYPTPRACKAVEIQALWYNALKIMCKLDEDYYELAENVKYSFCSQYHKQYDVIDTRDLSFRPNQIFLVSLDFSMIDPYLQRKIVEDIERRLLTPFGIRTLSPDDPRYKRSYIGDFNRDIAYHNGTVWAWLLGQFIKAFVKVKKYKKKWRKYAFDYFLKPMLNSFGDQWDGSINEIFDGDPPHLPRGCITQAWSVAEILRAWVEDILNIRPKYEKM